MRNQVVEVINPDLILPMLANGEGGEVEKGDPNELIIQTNLDFVDHGKLVDLALCGIKAKYDRCAEIEALFKRVTEDHEAASAVLPLTPDDIRLALSRARDDAAKADDLIRKITRKRGA